MLLIVHKREKMKYYDKYQMFLVSFQNNKIEENLLRSFLVML